MSDEKTCKVCDADVEWGDGVCVGCGKSWIEERSPSFEGFDRHDVGGSVFMRNLYHSVLYDDMAYHYAMTRYPSPGADLRAVANGLAAVDGGRIVAHRRTLKGGGPIHEGGTYYLSWKNGYAEVGRRNDGSVHFVVSHRGTDPVAVLDAFKAHTLATNPNPSTALMLVRDSHGNLTATEFMIPTLKLHADAYPKDLMEGMEHVVSCLRSNSPCGRLIIMDGKPGTGKTSLIRDLIRTVPECIFMVVPPNMVSNLQGPEIIPQLIEVTEEYNDPPRSLVLLVEDADHALQSRGTDNQDHIGTLLNFGDGILGCSLNLRVLCTTNVRNADGRDAAMMRPGRLCRSLHFEPLPPEQANALLVALKAGPVDRPFARSATLAEVYLAARNEGWVPPAEERVLGFKGKYSYPEMDE